MAYMCVVKAPKSGHTSTICYGHTLIHYIPVFRTFLGVNNTIVGKLET